MNTLVIVICCLGINLAILVMFVCFMKEIIEINVHIATTSSIINDYIFNHSSKEEVEKMLENLKKEIERTK